ncbi:hypothetical protein HanIR_Chr11g0506121 [Helianthus annuus]|nr:hypothetical protein HanIR_Chr11g0506121 [Helianthus annuus]
MGSASKRYLYLMQFKLYIGLYLTKSMKTCLHFDGFVLFYVRILLCWASAQHLLLQEFSTYFYNISPSTFSILKNQDLSFSLFPCSVPQLYTIKHHHHKHPK